jgi:hypothetical protein
MGRWGADGFSDAYLQGSEEQQPMSTTERTDRVLNSPPSSLRTELNIVAAVVALGLCVLILAMLAHAPAPGAAHHRLSRVHVHASAAPWT